jgi:hypothetical protein
MAGEQVSSGETVHRTVSPHAIRTCEGSEQDEASTRSPVILRRMASILHQRRSLSVCRSAVLVGDEAATCAVILAVPMLTQSANHFL